MDPVLIDLVFTHLAATVVVILTLVGLVALPWSSTDLRASRDALHALATLPFVLGRALPFPRGPGLLRTAAGAARGPFSASTAR